MASRPLQAQANADRKALDHAIDIFRGEIANLASHGMIDGATRAKYGQLIGQLSRELSDEAAAGRMTWQEAARQANQMRNGVMEKLRGRSTPVGRALAERIKSQGKTLNELIARKTEQLFGRGTRFDSLKAAERNKVFAAVVQSAGKPDPYWTGVMRGARVAGRALMILSVAVAVYNIATAEDHVGAAKKEGALLGGGIAGGMAGGALAGLVCGPGAPVCVTIGAFAGGAAAAFGVSLFF